MNDKNLKQESRASSIVGDNKIGQVSSRQAKTKLARERQNPRMTRFSSKCINKEFYTSPPLNNLTALLV